MVHFADSGVLGQEQPVEPSDVGHVTQQHDASGHLVRLDERDAVEEHGDIRSALDLLHYWQGGCQGPLDRRLLDPEIGQPPSFDLRVHAHPVEGVGGIRGGVTNPAFLVDEDHTVTDAGRLFGRHLLAGEREGSFGQHHCEPVEHVPVGALEVAGAAPRTSRHPSQHGNGLPFAPHWDAVEPDRLAPWFEHHLPARRLAGLESEDHQGPHVDVNRLAHQVLFDHCRAVRRSHLAQDHELLTTRPRIGQVRCHRRHEDEVGKGEVGQDAPGPE